MKETESGNGEWGKWSPEEMKAWWSQNQKKEEEPSTENNGECKMEKDDKVTAENDENIKDKETKEEENSEEPWKKWQGTPEAAEWWAKQGKK